MKFKKIGSTYYLRVGSKTMSFTRTEYIIFRRNLIQKYDLRRGY